MQSFLVIAGDVLAFLTATLTLAAEVARRNRRRRHRTYRPSTALTQLQDTDPNPSANNVTATPSEPSQHADDAFTVTSRNYDIPVEPPA